MLLFYWTILSRFDITCKRTKKGHEHMNTCTREIMNNSRIDACMEGPSPMLSFSPRFWSTRQEKKWISTGENARRIVHNMGIMFYLTTSESNLFILFIWESFWSNSIRDVCIPARIDSRTSMYYRRDHCLACKQAPIGYGHKLSYNNPRSFVVFIKGIPIGYICV